MKRESKTFKKYVARKRRVKAIRKKINGVADKPRLVVFRSAKHIYAQIINDEISRTLIAFSSLSRDFVLDKNDKKTEQSFKVGEKLGQLALEKGIKQICFDRNGYLYHGRIKALADGVRKAGLKF
ncbi:MAG: 50S ribosomal protein L18 [Candidatus Cloacimonetes bacterium]|nr:50S ribosomal protein L18 [Candidatus Cloacimonadota bacterium]